MAVGKKPVMIHYRNFDSSKCNGKTLEVLINSAMDTVIGGKTVRSRFSSRLLEVNEDNYFVNFFENNSGEMKLAFGDVLHFSKGHMQALFRVVDGDAPQVEVKQMPAPEMAEYVHSQMYWMVKGDHVFVIQSQSLKTAELEDYLSWLLHKKCKVLSEEIPVILAAKFDADKVGGDLEDIREIVVGGVATSRHEDSSTGVKVDSNITEVTQNQNLDLGATTGWEGARKILLELLGSDAKVDRFLDAVPPDVDLKVQVHIGYQTKKKKFERVALKQLEEGLRHLPDSQMKVRSRNVSKGVDGSVRLHHPVNVDLVRISPERSGTLLDPLDVQRAMVEAYTVFLSNGKIKP